jgi:polygalacturonase
MTIVNGGHFCILLTGVDNFSMDGVVMDTDRDGIDVDCCKNVRISNCAVNSPKDDAIVLKSSYALNEVRATENVIISNCIVSGYETGSFIVDNFKVAKRDRPVGRVKIGTESNGGFKNITISNVVFDHCRGLALETVDGGHIEDVTISNISMRHLSSAAFFLRLGSRLRGPNGTSVGGMRRVNINNVVASDVDPRYSSSIVGIPGHAIEEVSFNNIRIRYKGGLSLDDVGRPNPYDVPEKAGGYPEPNMFGVLPAYGVYIRHAQEIELTNVKVGFMTTDKRPAFVLEDVRDVDFHHDKAEKAAGVPTFVLRHVEDFILTNSRPVVNKHFKSVKRRVF